MGGGGSQDSFIVVDVTVTTDTFLGDEEGAVYEVALKRFDQCYYHIPDSCVWNVNRLEYGPSPTDVKAAILYWYIVYGWSESTEIDTLWDTMWISCPVVVSIRDIL